MTQKNVSSHILSNDKTKEKIAVKIQAKEIDEHKIKDTLEAKKPERVPIKANATAQVAE